MGGGIHLRTYANATVNLVILDSVIRNNQSLKRGGGIRAHAYVYVSPDGFCDDNSPGYATIGDALQWEDGLFVLWVAQGVYHEAVLLGEERQVTFQAGWDPSFSALSGSTPMIPSRSMRDWSPSTRGRSA